MPTATVNRAEEGFMIRKLAVALAAAGAALSVSSSALALDCHNQSRGVSAGEYQLATTATPFLAFPIGVDPQTHQPVFWNVMPDFKGNWYLLALTEGAPEPTGTTIDVEWGFIPPGTVPFFPGGHGNYTNGQVDDLLGLAACPMARQDVHGIQSGACS
jgi:hypothetical protein